MNTIIGAVLLVMIAVFFCVAAWSLSKFSSAEDDNGYNNEQGKHRYD